MSIFGHLPEISLCSIFLYFKIYMFKLFILFFKK